ncbi:MAG: glycosyltransferase family 4 protein [Phycisphaeraceae bacterium]|nr:MAG: glycosyltransferase family 4 protein [Phycisphaeraceae bacterium]
MPDPIPNTTPQPKVLILNQFYAPDVASTGHLLHELATDLAKRGFGVKVITCRPSYGPPETWVDCPLRETKDGVSVRRMLTTRFSKDRMLGRALNSATFVLPLMLRMLFASRKDTVHLYTTNPPFLGVIGSLVSLIRAHRYVLLLHDAYPQMAVWVGKIRKGGIIDRLWHFANRVTYGRASHTIVLCEAAKKLVCETYGVDPQRVHVIHNWADANELRPRPKHDNSFAKQHGLVQPFTLLYSGNLGLYYDFETPLGAAEILRDENVRLVLIGAGGRRQWIADEIKRRKLTNTILLPYQPIERLPESLTACDASLVSIARGIEGISFPSKLYSTLSVGKPVLAISEEDSELRQMVEDNDVGLWSKVGDPRALAQNIREMIKDPQRTLARGARARAFFEANFTIEASGSKYAEVLRLAAPDLAGPRSTHATDSDQSGPSLPDTRDAVRDPAA